MTKLSVLNEFLSDSQSKIPIEASSMGIFKKLVFLLVATEASKS